MLAAKVVAEEWERFGNRNCSVVIATAWPTTVAGAWIRSSVDVIVTVVAQLARRKIRNLVDVVVAGVPEEESPEERKWFAWDRWETAVQDTLSFYCWYCWCTAW